MQYAKMQLWNDFLRPIRAYRDAVRSQADERAKLTAAGRCPDCGEQAHAKPENCHHYGSNPIFW